MSKTCRTCLVGIRDTTYIKLNDNDVKPGSVRAKLLACVPELQLDLVKDPVICCNCVNILQLSYDFKTRCLLTEERIRNCLRSAELNGKPVTLTKLFRLSRETNKGKHCSRVNGRVVEDCDNVNSDPTAGERSPAQAGRACLDIEADNDEHERIDDYIISTANEDSDVVMSSEVGLVDDEGESDVEDMITNNGTTMGSTLQPMEFRDKILGWSSAATCTDILGDLVNTMDDAFVKEEHESLLFKIETDETLSFKEESSNNDEEKRSNDCKTGTWEGIKEETQSITDDAGGMNVVEGEYEFPAAADDGENFEGSDSTNLDNQIKKSSVSVRRLSTNSNYSSELYSDSTASSDANITEPIDKKRGVSYEEETTNNYSTSSLIQNSQEMSDTNEDSLTKKEHELEILKSKESLNEKTFKSCTINTDVPIKECFVNLQRLHVGELMNESSFNAKELFTITSAKSLQTTNKKPESARHNGKSNFSKQQQADSKKKSFCCNVCEYRSTRKENLKSHMRIHRGEKPFKCNVCDYSATLKLNVINHMRIHSGEKPFRCNVCNFSTAYKSAVTVHLRVHTGEKPFKCNICQYSANQKQTLNNHMRTHIGEKPFKCNFCEYSATMKQTVIIHMRTHSGEKPFRCNVCDFSTAHQKNLTLHLRIHTGEKPFKCKVCEYSATLKQNLINHMRTHSGEKPFRCKVCDFSTAHKKSLTLHLRVHTGEKSFKCNVCKYSANRKQNLYKHMRIHTGEKPFQCNVCEYSAAQKQNLIIHMRTHTGEKPFHCNVCEYSAVMKQNLISHMRTHTGEKPFQCKVCKFSAARKQSLIIHMRTHTGEKPFHCNRCEYSAVTKQNLIIHMRSHTGEKPFQCNFCGYKAVHKQHLITHIRTHTRKKQYR